MALQDARSEVKELKEVMESVSTKNWVFCNLLLFELHRIRVRFFFQKLLNSSVICHYFRPLLFSTPLVLFPSLSIVLRSPSSSPSFPPHLSPPNTLVVFFIAFVRRHPNLVCLWHKATNCRGIVGDCRLAAPTDFIRGINDYFLVVFFVSRKKGTSRNICSKWRLKLRCIENILKVSKW